MHTSPLRTSTAVNKGAASTLENMRELSLRMGAFMLWIVCDPSYKSESMLAWLRGVSRVHKALGYDFGPLGQVSVACKGATPAYMDEHGPEALMPKRKKPLTNAILFAIMGLRAGCAIGPYIVGTSLEWLGVEVFVCLRAKSGFRKAEVALDSSVVFGKRHLSLYNARWWIGGRWVERPAAAVLPRCSQEQTCYTSSRRQARQIRTAPSGELRGWSAGLTLRIHSPCSAA